MADSPADLRRATWAATLKRTVDMTALESAAGLGEHRLRPLDAVHLGTALSLGEDLESFVAYDERLLNAAHATGLSTEQPR